MFVLSGTGPALCNGDSVDKTHLVPEECTLGKEQVCGGMGNQRKGQASQGQSDRVTQLGIRATSEFDMSTGIMLLQTKLQVQSSLGVLQA